MRRLSRILGTAVMVLSVAASAQAQGRKSRSRRSGMNWKALLTTVYDAWSTLEAENAAPFYAKDADLAFFDAAPLKYSGWAAYAEGDQKAFLDGTTRLTFRPNDDLKTTERGDVAWMTLTLHVTSVRKDGKTLELDCRHTLIWERRGGKWLIVHEHLSAPLPD